MARDKKSRLNGLAVCFNTTLRAINSVDHKHSLYEEGLRLKPLPFDQLSTLTPLKGAEHLWRVTLTIWEENLIFGPPQITKPKVSTLGPLEWLQITSDDNKLNFNRRSKVGTTMWNQEELEFPGRGGCSNTKSIMPNALASSGDI